MPIIDELIAVVEVRDNATPDLQKIEREALKNAQALARMKAASGDAAGAAETLRSALDNASVVNYRHGLQVEAQIARYERAVEKSNAWNQALGALGAVGLTLSAGAALDAAQRIGEFVLSANEAARETERAQATLRVLTGSQEEYARVVALAKEQQTLFGGSLAANIEKLSGLQVAARQSGADLSTLVDLAQRLSVLSPEQGIEGARVALAEAMSGDIRSLAERFEIPRDEIRDLADTSLSAADRLRVLDEYLTRIGVSSEAVGGAIPETTRTVNQLSAAWEELTLTIGRGADPAIREGSAALADALERITLGAQIAIAVRDALDRKFARDAGRSSGGWGEEIAAQAQAAAMETRASAEVIEEATTRIEQATSRGTDTLERLFATEREAQERRVEAVARVNERILDIRAQAATREASILEQAQAAATLLAEEAERRRVDVIAQANEQRAAILARAAEQEAAIERQRADALTAIAEREADERERLAQRLEETRRRTQEALAEFEQNVAERTQETTEDREERRREREERRAERRAELEKRIAEATTAEARAAAEAALAAFNEREAREEARIAQREARDDERRRRQDEKRRADLERQRAEAEAAAQAEAEAIARRAAEARAKEEAEAQARKERLAAETQERLAALQAETTQRLAEIDKRLAQEEAKERASVARRIEETRKAAIEREQAERESYERALAAAEATYRKQTESLRRALGEQIAEIVQAQAAMGALTPEQAQERMTTLRAAYGYVPQAERAQAFQNLATAFLGGVNITIQGVTQPEQVAQAVRSELLRLQRAGERGL